MLVNRLARHIKFSSKLGNTSTTPTDTSRKPFLNYLKEDCPLPMTSANKFRNLEVAVEAQCSSHTIAEHLKLIQAQRLEHRREFLIAGMSNAGKSSLINSFLGEKVARVSNRPGKTRQIFFYTVQNTNSLVLVDSPGYGYAEGSKQEVDSWKKLMTTYLKHASQLHRE